MKPYCVVIDGDRVKNYHLLIATRRQCTSKTININSISENAHDALVSSSLQSPAHTYSVFWLIRSRRVRSSLFRIEGTLKFLCFTRAMAYICRVPERWFLDIIWQCDWRRRSDLHNPNTSSTCFRLSFCVWVMVQLFCFPKKTKQKQTRVVVGDERNTVRASSVTLSSSRLNEMRSQRHRNDIFLMESGNHLCLPSVQSVWSGIAHFLFLRKWHQMHCIDKCSVIVC